MSRMHLLMAGASLALLIVTLLVLRADHQREWKKYQRRFQEQVAPWLEQAEQARKPAIRQGSGSPSQAVTRRPTAAGTAPGVWSRRMLHWPLIEALARPLRIEQFVLPELPLEYHFARAVRVDRCTTCHQAVALADRDDAAQPLLPPEHRFGVRLEPRSPAGVQQWADAGPSGAAAARTRLQEVFGLRLAASGMLDPDAPAIALIEPASPAALAGLRAGDVIEQLDGRPVGARTQAERHIPLQAIRAWICTCRRRVPIRPNASAALFVTVVKVWQRISSVQPTLPTLPTSSGNGEKHTAGCPSLPGPMPWWPVAT